MAESNQNSNARGAVAVMVATTTHKRLRLAAAISGKKVQELASEILEKGLNQIPGLAEAEKSAGGVKFSRRRSPVQAEEVAAV